MKLLKNIFLVATFLLVPTLLSATNIGVVDLEIVLKESKVRQDVMQQIEERTKLLQTEFEKEEKRLKEKQEKLQAKEAIISKELFQKEVEEYQRESDTVNRAIQEKSMKLQEAASTAEMKIFDKIMLIAGEVAQEKNFDMIMSRQILIHSSNALDITADVQKKLDAQLPKLKLEANK